MTEEQFKDANPHIDPNSDEGAVAAVVAAAARLGWDKALNRVGEVLQKYDIPADAWFDLGELTAERGTISFEEALGEMNATKTK